MTTRSTRTGHATLLALLSLTGCAEHQKSPSEAGFSPDSSVPHTDAGNASPGTDASLRDGSASPRDDASIDAGEGDAGCSPAIVYRDADGDGLGRPTDTMTVCKVPPGWVSDHSDCDDSDPELGATASVCPLCQSYRADGSCVRACDVAPCLTHPECGGDAPDDACMCPAASVDIRGDGSVCALAAQWSRSLGVASFAETIGDLLRDRAGNLWLNGEVFGVQTLQTPSGPIELGRADQYSAFLLKVDTSPAHALSPRVLWATSHSAGGSRQEFSRLAEDDAGNIWWAGSFFAAMDLATGLTGDGDEVFLAKLTADGNIAFARSLGGVGSQALTGLAVSGGHVWLTGNFSGSLNLSADSAPAYAFDSKGGADNFIAELDGDGKHLWSSAFGGPNDDVVHQLIADGKGGVWFATQVLERLTWGGETWSFSTDQQMAALGHVTGAHSVDLPVIAAPVDAKPVLSRFVSLARDSHDNLWATGDLQERHGSIDMFASASLAFGEHTVTVPAGNIDMLIVKADPTGKVLFAEASGREPPKVGTNSGEDIAVSPDDESVWVVGIDTYYRGDHPDESFSDDYMRVMQLDSQGKHLRTMRFGSYPGQQSMWDRVEVGPSGQLWLAGGFEGVLDFFAGVSDATHGPLDAHGTINDLYYAYLRF